MNVFITGVSNGIGRELALSYLNSGDTVTATTRDIQRVPVEIRNNPNASLIQFDFLDIKAGLRSKVENLKNLEFDVLINNAGLLSKGSLIELQLNDAYNMYAVNALMPLELTRTLLKANALKKGASVINISSMGGFQGAQKFEGLAAYSMSKAALVALTECMAAEWKDLLYVNCLCLGAVNTDMLKTAFPNYIAPTSDVQMANFIHHFSKISPRIMTGSVIPVAISNP